MLIWLVRHAVAVEREEFDGPDEARPLTDKGRRQFRAFVKWLESATAAPGAIVTSPLVRAVQTAEILRKGMGLKKKDVLENAALAPGADPHGLLGVAKAAGFDSMALVGHEPDWSAALSAFVGGGAFDFDKGSIAAVEFTGEPAPGAGRLCWFAGPRLRS